MKQAFINFIISGALITSGMVMAAQPTHSSYIKIPTTADLSKVAQIAHDKNLPIILVYSADHCPYCELLENEILKPMILSGDYTDRVLIVKLNIDDADVIRDFDGTNININDFSMQHDLFVTPTMLFFDADGNELHERILGINTVELFGDRVDSAIDHSLAKLRNQNQAIAKIQP